MSGTGQAGNGGGCIIAMNSRYQTELDEFRGRFQGMKDKRIVLYGIGRYTATLIEGIKDYHFTGLMDKDPANLGKEYFGFPVIDLKTAEEKADLIIINTSETYWQVIYRRIKDSRIPVYFKNGKRARVKEEREKGYPYENLSLDEIRGQIKQADVISFDFFDTLFVRKVCSPGDVFKLLELAFYGEWTSGTEYTQVRKKAVEELRTDYSIEELTGISHKLSDEIRYKEIELEKQLLVPREDITELLYGARRLDKEIYVTTDMYLPKSFYLDMLDEYGIEIPEDNILLSNELDKSKADGSIWGSITGENPGRSEILHIGDDLKADVTIPKNFGIATYHTPSAWEVLCNSSLSELASGITTDYASAVTGCVIARLFNNPYSLGKTEGRVTIKDNRTMGCCVFGPVILTFLLWLEWQKEKCSISRFVFMSRDGYFLKEDHDCLCAAFDKEADSIYIGISRQLAMTAAVRTEEDLVRFLEMPYTGSISEMLEDRLGFLLREADQNAAAEADGHGCAGTDAELKKVIGRHGRELLAAAGEIRADYKAYLDRFGLNDDDAVVDLGYYGNNQRYLNKITGADMPGFYFNADLSEKNENAQSQKMHACFQSGEDKTAENSEVLKRMIFLESFLTAPYGMVREVSADGEFGCAPDGGNQKFFKDKEEINEGVREFIKDYCVLFGPYNLTPDTEFADAYYGKCFDGSVDYSDDVKRSFYNDNAMMNRIESQLFY